MGQTTSAPVRVADRELAEEGHHVDRIPEPDAAILARRDEILRGLAPLVAARGADRPRRTSAAPSRPTALTAYRRLPLAVVLPSTTEEVSRRPALLPRATASRSCRAGPAPRCPAARMPQEDAIILGVAKMNRVLDDRFRRTAPRACRPASPISPSPTRSPHEGFFYAPDPSSQLACTIAGNIAMNSGGAHCLKYGVTTNNLLGVTHGADRRHGRRARRRRISTRPATTCSASSAAPRASSASSPRRPCASCARPRARARC